MIKVLPYNPHWPDMFELEAAYIKKALGANCLSVHHVGSTSVPGLAAKPIIDVIVVVNDMNFSWRPLEEADYVGRGEFHIPFRLYFKKQEGDDVVHLHVYEKGNPEIELNLMFRDHLRNHPNDLELYAKLKLDLVANKDLHEKNEKIFSGYNLGKNQLIKSILEKAGFQKNCMRFCAHDDEWETVQNFRQKYFFDQEGIEDPDTWTFNHLDHIHFVFYQGTQIVGYSHVENRQSDGIIRMIIIDDIAKGRGLDKDFLNLIERWLKQKKYQAKRLCEEISKDLARDSYK